PARSCSATEPPGSLVSNQHLESPSSPTSNASAMDTLRRELSGVLLRDAQRLGKRLAGLERRRRQGKPVDRGIREIQQEIARSRASVEARRQRPLTLAYPEALPVSQRREDILEALRDHQVVVVAGETGSGKTT